MVQIFTLCMKHAIQEGNWERKDYVHFDTFIVTPSQGLALDRAVHYELLRHDRPMLQKIRHTVWEKGGRLTISCLKAARECMRVGGGGGGVSADSKAGLSLLNGSLSGTGIPDGGDRSPNYPHAWTRHHSCQHIFCIGENLPKISEGQGRPLNYKNISLSCKRTVHICCIHTVYLLWFERFNFCCKSVRCIAMLGVVKPWVRQESIQWFIEGQAFSPTSPPPPVSKLDRATHARRLRKRDNFLAGESRGERCVRSWIIRPRESLVSRNNSILSA